jgi:ribonuclease HI
MELTAVIEAIKCLKTKNVTLDIYSDSSYVVNFISVKGWVNNWVKNNFKDKKNKDLLVRILRNKQRLYNKYDLGKRSCC